MHLLFRKAKHAACWDTGNKASSGVAYFTWKLMITNENDPTKSSHHFHSQPIPSWRLKSTVLLDT